MPATGVITQVIGSTFDCQFPEDQLPDIYNAVTVDTDTRVGKLNLTGEVQKHLGGGQLVQPLCVRRLADASTSS